jgi:Uncharacterized protein conserved in bacteria (DUF2188)
MGTPRHVVKQDGKWAVRKEGSDRASAICDTQAEAERVAKTQQANDGGGEVVIHRPTGPIRDKDTVAPGNDPPSRKDTKH